MPRIADPWRQDLHAYIAGTLRGLGAEAVIVGGTSDHVHVLARIRSHQSVAGLVREVKKAATAWAKQHDPRFAWQTGYAVFSVSSELVPMIIRYIARQEEHHRRVSSAEELRTLLAEEGIEIEERFFE
jgi:REP element-mobilizing transposase RayT